MQNKAAETNTLGKLTQSVQFKFVLAFFAIIAALLVAVDIYPITTSRDLVFSEKESGLVSQSGVISSSLAALDTLTSESVGQVIALLDITGLERIMVTDEGAKIIYDSSEESTIGNTSDIEDVLLALSGKQAFRSSFADGAFTSSATLPVYVGGNIAGAVYISEVDTAQAELINSVQSGLWMISLVSLVAALTLSIVFTRAITGRITRLAEGMRVVRDGDYKYRVTPEGNDELTELSEEFNELTERLETTENERRRFVSDASHELKTPVAAIRLLADSILQTEDMDSETVREFVSDIASEADRLQRTSEKLLDLSRRDAGAVTARERVDLAAVAEGTCRLLTPLAEQNDVKISCKASVPCYVTASEDELYQIVFNLAENAVKYNVSGGSVAVEVAQADKRVRLTVSDSGIGIPDEDMPHIFERFYRVDKARSRERGGSGLGLSIVHDAVQSLGGEISAESREEGGTRFVVDFAAADV